MSGSLLRGAVLLLAGAFGVACSSDDDGTGPRSGVVEIQVSGTRFSPSNVEITPGTTVRWVASEGGHTITPDDPNREGVWQEVNVTEPGAVFEHRFEVAGQTYDYHCVPHRDAGMTGRIWVVAD